MRSQKATTLKIDGIVHCVLCLWLGSGSGGRWTVEDDGETPTTTLGAVVVLEEEDDDDVDCHVCCCWIGANCEG